MKQLHIALVAHDQRKEDLIDCILEHKDILKHHKLYATGTTGKILQKKYPHFDITIFNSGPLGGDQQIGALIATDTIDALIFFWDPMNPQPHEPDVRALIRLSVLRNIIIVEDRTTASLVMSSPLFGDDNFNFIKPDYSQYLNRDLN